jgi:hypothetical protein
MSTAGYNMKFGKGYLGPGSGGGKDMAPKGQPAGEEHQEGSDDESGEGAIHEHLQKMHEMTGHGHSHIEHKPEGHMAHHIDHEGQISGPEPTEDCPGGMCGGGM